MELRDVKTEKDAQIFIGTQLQQIVIHLGHLVKTLGEISIELKLKK